MVTLCLSSRCRQRGHLGSGSSSGRECTGLQVHVLEFGGELPKHTGNCKVGSQQNGVSSSDARKSFPVEMLTEKVTSLGLWRRNQCAAHKKGKMPASWIAELKRIPGRI